MFKCFGEGAHRLDQVLGSQTVGRVGLFGLAGHRLTTPHGGAG